MAIYSGSNFGTLRNKIGGAVGYTSRGQTIARSMPQGYTDANTVVQQINRLKAAAVGKWIRYHKAKLTAFIGRPKAPQTKVSTIQKELYKFFTYNETLVGLPDYNNPYRYFAASDNAIEFGEGNIEFPENMTVTYNSATKQVTFIFSGLIHTDKSSGEDTLSFLLISCRQNGIYVFNTTTPRSSGADNIQLPDIQSGSYKVYPLFVSSIYGSSFTGVPSTIDIP